MKVQAAAGVLRHRFFWGEQRRGAVRVHSPRLALALCIATIGSSVALGCSGGDQEDPDAATFYQRQIAPIVQTSCANSPTGSSCHITQDTRGNAFGNLSVQSYDKLLLRRDLFINYGPYSMPALLLKAVPPHALRLTNWEDSDPVLITTDIPHVGGALLSVGSTGFTQLQRWIRRGATENNIQAPERVLERTPCRDTLGSDPLFDPTANSANADYDTFLHRVNPVLGQQCAGGNCHGSPTNSLYLTCGEGSEQERWNYFAVADYVAATAENSELLRRTLSQSAGGTYHEGGAIFTSDSDPGYRALLEWAREKGGPSQVPAEPGFRFFADRIQPMLVKKGCMIVGCHSPAMFHDYRLRGGSGGHFGLPATRTNYELTLEQVNLASTDATASRLVRKNLPLGEGGLRHRGGALFAGSDRDACDATLANTGPLDEQDPYCVIDAWLQLERTARRAGLADWASVVYVSRPIPTTPDTAQDYEAWNPGADLLRAPVAVDAEGWPTLGAAESLLTACGLAAGVDVRRPAVSWDGSRIAFSARGAAATPWQIHVIEADGTCALEPTVAAAPVDDRGLAVPSNDELVHNLDPAFAPNGSLVFTSTRGSTVTASGASYAGPQRSPADPSRLNANLYVLENGVVRQLTFLLDQEIQPAFMGDGRLIFTTEKRAPGFYQLAGRRINLDGGDYHPLFGQRSTIGYNQMTDVVELGDKNLAAIFSERGATRGAGALAVINRSIGIDQASTNEADYLQDPGAIAWPNEDFYQHSLTVVDPASTGRLSGSQGAYRNPSPLPDGKVIVGYAAGAADLASFSEPFALAVVEPQTGERRILLQGTQDLVWPVAVFARDNRGVFASRLDEANGATQIVSGLEGNAEVTYLDLPFFTSLLMQNTRSRRLFERTPGSVEFWEHLPPPVGVRSYAEGGEYVTSDAFGSLYVRRRRLGSVMPDEDDGSAKVLLPGGVPVSLATRVPLAGEDEAELHHQLEATQFYPGELVRQGFPRELFSGLCGGCHGSLSGRESEIAVNPDILTQASQVSALGRRAVNMTEAPEAPRAPPFP